MKNALIFILILWNSFVGAGQEFTIKGEILWSDIHPTGQFLVCTDENFYIFDYPNSKVHEFANVASVPRTSFNYIPDSPYIVINFEEERGKIKVGIKKENYSIIDVLSGEELFNMRDLGYGRVFSEKIIPDLGVFIVVAKKKKETLVSAINIEDGQELWSFRPDFKGNFANVFSWEKVTPSLLKDGILALPFGKKLYGLNGVSGEKIWERDIQKPDVSFVTEDGTKLILADNKLSKSYVYCFDYKTGSDAWKPKKLVGNYQSIWPVEAGLLLSTYVQLDLLDLKNGESLWEEKPKVGGLFESVKELEDGYLVVSKTFSAGTKVNYLDFDGNPKWKKSNNLGKELYHLSESGKDFLYFTEKKYNRFDLETGKDLFKKLIKFKVSDDKPLLIEVDESRNRVIVFNEGNLFSIDRESGTAKVLASKIKFDGDEVPSELSIINGGYLLKASQNIWLISFDGKKVYDKYFQSPYGDSGLWKRALIGSALNIANASFIGATSGSYRYGYGYRTNNSAVIPGTNSAKRSMNKAAKKIQDRIDLAKKQKSTSVFAAKIKSGKKKKTYLIQINIDTGKEINRIEMDDRNPVFIADVYGGLVYYLDVNSTFQVFTL